MPIIYLSSTSNNEVAWEILDEFEITGVPAILIVKEGKVIEYLYDDKWTSKGLADANMVVNLEVIREFFDEVNK